MTQANDYHRVKGDILKVQNCHEWKSSTLGFLRSLRSPRSNNLETQNYENSKWKLAKTRWNPKFGLSDLENDLLTQRPRKNWCTDFKNIIFEKIHSASSKVVEVKRSFSRSLRPNFGFHLVFSSFRLEFSSFWVSRLFDLSDLGDLRRGSGDYKNL